MSDYTNSNIFPDYTDKDFNNLFTLNTCENNNEDNCIFYMFKNGQNIYKQIDMFNSIPEEAYKDKLIKLFEDRDSLLMRELFADEKIQNIKDTINNQISTDKVINHILMHIKPELFNTTTTKVFTMSDINRIKEKVINTLQFNIDYMNTLESQIDFLFKNTTIDHIKDKTEQKLLENNITIDINKDYIKSIMHYELDNYRQDKTKAGKPNMNKNSLRTIEGTFISQQSRLQDKDIFIMINDVIAKIYSTIFVEKNVEKNNKKLDKWDTILGDNNRHGLRQYSNIKLNNKKPQSMLFNMNY